MPNTRLKRSHMMTIGAKELASLVVPKGWMRKSTTKIAHDTPTIVVLEISGATTSKLKDIIS